MNWYVLFLSALLLILLLQSMYFGQMYMAIHSLDLLWYSLFILCCFIYQFLDNTNTYKIENKALQPWLKIASAFSIGFYYLFIMHLFNLKKISTLLYKLYLLFFITNCIFIIFYLVTIFLKIKINNAFMPIVGLIVFPFYVYALYKLWKIKTNYTKWICLGICFLLLGMFASAILHLLFKNDIPSPHFVKMPAQVGLLTDLFFISKAIIIKYSSPYKKA